MSFGKRNADTGTSRGADTRPSRTAASLSDDQLKFILSSNQSNYEVSESGETKKKCPHCAELVQARATTCPHCRNAIFATDPGANALIGAVSTIAAFFVLWYAITAFSEAETDRLMERSATQVERMMQRFQ